MIMPVMVDRTDFLNRFNRNRLCSVTDVECLPKGTRHLQGTADLGTRSTEPQTKPYEQLDPMRSPRTQPASICHSGSSRLCQRRGPLCV